ncbi:hypothetical protein ACVLV4_003033, partial [Rathayibacter agropyri]
TPFRTSQPHSYGHPPRTLSTRLVNNLMNNALTSPNGRFSATMQTDGNLAVYSGSQSTWSSGTNGNAGTKLSVQSDGNLVLYSAANTSEWQSGTSGTATSTVLTMQNDGNLVLYSTGGISLWSTLNGPTGYSQDHVVSSQTLRSTWALVSSNLRYKAAMQSDGNFVVYDNSTATFSTETKGGNRLVLQDDGNVVVLASDGSPLWNAGTGGYSRSTTLTMQNDGTLLLTSAGAVPLWSARLGDIIKPALSASISADINHRNAQSLITGAAQIRQYPQPTSSETSDRASAVAAQDEQLKRQRDLYVNAGEKLTSFSTDYAIDSITISGMNASAVVSERTYLTRAGVASSANQHQSFYALQQTARLEYGDEAWKLNNLDHQKISDDRIPETILPSSQSVAAQSDGSAAKKLDQLMDSKSFSQSDDALSSPMVTQGKAQAEKEEADKKISLQYVAGSPYDKRAAVLYARQHAENRAPATQFKPNDDDCASFISQALSASGWPQVGGPIFGDSDEHNWFGNAAKLSDTWGKAQPLFDYGFHTTGRFHYVDNSARPGLGDITFWIWSNKKTHLPGNYVFDHASIVTSLDPNGMPYYSYHSDDIRDKPLSAILAQDPNAIYSDWSY